MREMEIGIYSLQGQPIGVIRWLEELNKQNTIKTCLAFVGAGGKTSCMYYVAGECAKAGKKVLVTTSTHILPPEPDVAAYSIEEVEVLWKQGKYAVIGKESKEKPIGKADIDSKAQYCSEDLCTPVRKWSAPDPSLFQEIYEQADIVLIEADGSRGKPCKARREYEPVIWEEVTHIISVIGLSALGQTIEEGSYPPELVAEILGKDRNQVLSLKDLSMLVENYWQRDFPKKFSGEWQNAPSQKPSGEWQNDMAWRERYEPIVLMNQVDDTKTLSQAKELANMIQMSGIRRLYLSCFLGENASLSQDE